MKLSVLYLDENKDCIQIFENDKKSNALEEVDLCGNMLSLVPLKLCMPGV